MEATPQQALFLLCVDTADAYCQVQDDWRDEPTDVLGEACEKWRVRLVHYVEALACVTGNPFIAEWDRVNIYRNLKEEAQKRYDRIDRKYRIGKYDNA